MKRNALHAAKRFGSLFNQRPACHLLRLGQAHQIQQRGRDVDLGYERVGSDRDRRIRYRTHGQATFFRYNDGVRASGQRLRVNPHLYYYHGPFGLLTEWVHNSQELERGTNAKTVDSYAWTFQTSYVLTGENASYSGVRPSSPFNPSQGTWGAFELGIRATELNVGDSAFSETADTRLARSNSTQKATAYTLGINWYLTDNLKAALNYSVTDFSGLGLSRSSEEVLASRFQIDF